MDFQFLWLITDYCANCFYHSSYYLVLEKNQKRTLKNGGITILKMTDKNIEDQIVAKKAELSRLEHELSESKSQKNKPQEWFKGNGLYWIIGIVVLLIFFNGFQLMNLSSSLEKTTTTTSTSVIGELSLDAHSTLGPALVSVLKEPPVLSGYKTKVTKFPTISEHSIPAKTGDKVQDALNALVPTGTPWYGAEAEVSFDDPIVAQNKWGTYEQNIKLSPELQQRWNNIVNTFTCDYCCGSPQNPTIISRCGCGHARAWRGMAKWFLNKYGNKYSDAQIIGEMTRWKVIWYPGPTIQRAIQEGAL